MKRIILVWTLVAVAMIASLTIIFFKFKEKEINNLNEQAIKKMAETYLNTYSGEFPNRGKSKKITLDTLIEKKHDPKLEEGCDGYVIVENTEMGFKFTPYIKCPDYTTEGYKEN